MDNQPLWCEEVTGNSGWSRLLDLSLLIAVVATLTVVVNLLTTVVKGQYLLRAFRRIQVRKIKDCSAISSPDEVVQAAPVLLSSA